MSAGHCTFKVLERVDDATNSYAKGSAKAMRAEFGTDQTLKAIADGLADVQKRYGYQLVATIKSDTQGHFSWKLDLETDMISHRSITDADDEAMRLAVPRRSPGGSTSTSMRSGITGCRMRTLTMR